MIAEAAMILRSDETLLQTLRLRVSDLKTRVADLLQNNDDILNDLRAIEERMP